MGNTASTSGRHHEDTVDFGHLSPQGVYSGPVDWNHQIVTQLICERKLAPFYRPLEEYSPKWDDEQILAARKPLPETDNPQNESQARSDAGSTRLIHNKRPTATKELSRLSDAQIYRGAVECPICFLYYPPNINYSRCCEHAICTECFVRIKRGEPTTTHLVSDPAACPYCVQDNFGVVYTPPQWRAGLGSGGFNSWTDGRGSSVVEPSTSATHKRRQKVYSHDSPEVVTIDQIRPDWEAKLAAVRAAVTRRANRRIIMRQVGDRLIPVGVTSGRAHVFTEEGQTEGGEVTTSSSRRSRRRQQAAQNQDISQLLGSMGVAGQDLEEFMLMEAMRLSLLDHEEHQRREARNQQNQTENSQTEQSGVTTTSQPLQIARTVSTGSSPSSSLPSGIQNLSLLESSDATTPVRSAGATPSRSITPLPPPSGSQNAASNGARISQGDQDSAAYDAQMATSVALLASAARSPAMGEPLQSSQQSPGLTPSTISDQTDAASWAVHDASHPANDPLRAGSTTDDDDSAPEGQWLAC